MNMHVTLVTQVTVEMCIKAPFSLFSYQATEIKQKYAFNNFKFQRKGRKGKVSKRNWSIELW